MHLLMQLNKHLLNSGVVNGPMMCGYPGGGLLDLNQSYADVGILNMAIWRYHFLEWH